MADVEPCAPILVKDTRCPRCGVPTDTLVEEVPLILWCEPCQHKWINLSNLPNGA